MSSDQDVPQANRRQLKNFLVGSQRQLRYSLGFLFVGIFFLSCYMFGFLYFFKDSILSLTGATGLPAETSFGILQSLQTAMYLVVIFSVLIAVAIFVVGTIVSHRVFGPFVQIVRFLEEIKAGNYKERIQLRKDDEFQDVAQLLNDLASRLDTSTQK